MIFLLLNQILIKNTFGQLIFLFAFFISIVFVGLYELRKNSDYFLDFNLKKYMLNIKYAIPYILFTLIPVVRYLVANSGIFFTNEKVLLFSLFLFLSGVLIIIYSSFFDTIINLNLFKTFNASLLLLVYEMPSLTFNFDWINVLSKNYLVLIVFFIFIFFYLISNNSLIQIYSTVLVFGIVSIIPNYFNSEVDRNFQDQKSTSPFNLINGIDNPVSIILLVYDGYPQLETLEYLGIDNSKQVKYLLDNNFTIYNGVFSFENSTLGTMGGLFQGETKYYGQNNTRLITGGYSTLVEKLIDNNYVAFGIFSNSFYLPPNEVPN